MWLIQNGACPDPLNPPTIPGTGKIVYMATPRTGGCLCGAIRYVSDGDVMFALRCHCRDCQRQSGAASVAAIRVPAARFHITKGTPKRFVAQADSGNEIARGFVVTAGPRSMSRWLPDPMWLDCASARSTILHRSVRKPIFLSEARSPGNRLTPRCPNIRTIRLVSPIRRRPANDRRRRSSPPNIRVRRWRRGWGSTRPVSNTREVRLSSIAGPPTETANARPVITTSRERRTVARTAGNYNDGMWQDREHLKATKGNFEAYFNFA